MPKGTPDNYMALMSSAYDFVTKPLPFFGSAKNIAEKYYRPDRTVHANVDSLIRWHSAVTAAGGFIAGIGGLVAMPVTLPADFALSIYFQLRMVGAIAYLYGHDIQSDPVISMAGLSLCGNKATEILQQVGIKIIGKQLVKSTTKMMSAQIISAINKAIGLKLLSQFGSKNALNFGKAVPFIGALVGSSFNYASTMKIGKTAKMLFKN